MSPNWTRGFFRLWLAVAICWVIPTSIAFRDSFAPIFQSGVGKADTSPRTQISAEDHAKLDALLAEVESMIFLNAVVAAGTVTGPPLILLLIGVSLGWILNGFSSQKKSTRTAIRGD